MSKTKQVVELSFPIMKTKYERFTGLVQQCNYCCGKGWFWGRDGAYESVKETCPMCEGTGKMQPVITIEWEPVCQDK